jgi:hypothetical protein
MTMKQFMIVAIAIIAVVAFATPIFASQDEAGPSAVVGVYATVSATITVTGDTTANGGAKAQLSGGTSNGSTWAYGTIYFDVDANTQDVTLQVFASDLYKGDDGVTPGVASIPLDSSKGAQITCTGLEGAANANATGGANNCLAFGYTVASICYGDSTFTANGTAAQEFEAGTIGVFSELVGVQLHWASRGNAQLPQGEYSGIVELVAAVVPGT